MTAASTLFVHKLYTLQMRSTDARARSGKATEMKQLVQPVEGSETSDDEII